MLSRCNSVVRPASAASSRFISSSPSLLRSNSILIPRPSPSRCFSSAGPKSLNLQLLSVLFRSKDPERRARFQYDKQFWNSLTPEEKIQAEWAAWDSSKKTLGLYGIALIGIGIVTYWYRKEVDHFTHHRHVSPPYSFITDRSQNVEAGWWPGRHCQFFEFNCFSAVYQEADKLLRKQRGEDVDDDHHGHH